MTHLFQLGPTSQNSCLGPGPLSPRGAMPSPVLKGESPAPRERLGVFINGEATQFIHPHWRVSMALGRSEEEKVWRPWS